MGWLESSHTIAERKNNPQVSNFTSSGQDRRSNPWPAVFIRCACSTKGTYRKSLAERYVCQSFDGSRESCNYADDLGTSKRMAIQLARLDAFLAGMDVADVLRQLRRRSPHAARVIVALMAHGG